MAKRKKKNVRRPAPRPVRQAPLFDQNNAPVPPPRRAGRNGGVQQIELNLGEMPARAPAPAQRPPQVKKSRNSRARAVRRRVTKGEMRRRRRNRRILAGLLICALIITGVVLSFTVLFKIETITVQNLDRSTPADTGPYAEEAITAALGVAVGDQLYSFNAQEKAQELSLEFPLLETVEVYQHIPSTVIVRVQPAVATYCVQTTAGWATLSEQFKVMELSNTQPAGLLSILGLDVQTPVPGTFLQLDLPDPTEKPAEQTDSSSGADSSASSAEATPAPTAEPEDRSGDLLLLRQILKQLEEEGLLDSVTQLDMTDLSQISVTYDGRIKVLLGTSNNLTYKIQFTQAILTSPDGLSATDTGTLDVSNIREDGTIRPVFSPD